MSRLPCELGFLMLSTSCSFFRLIDDQKEADGANGPAFPRKAHFTPRAHLHAFHPTAALLLILASLFLAHSHSLARARTHSLTHTHYPFTYSAAADRLHERSLIVKPANPALNMQISSHAEPMIISVGVSLCP